MLYREDALRQTRFHSTSQPRFKTGAGKTHIITQMIWLSSFPRSGNTFLRNILYSVYGLPSSTFHQESAYLLDKDFDSYTFVKTHELPSSLDARGFSQNLPSVYLVRDGRDAICSIAHHKANLIAPGTKFEDNAREAIIASKGSYFGGWSKNSQEWLERADLIIRYEDLIHEPLATVERFRQIIDLPEPDSSRIPTFEQLKYGVPEYGAGKRQPISEDRMRDNAQKFFRRGEAGAWKDEMTEELQEFFWSYHGEMMSRFGYARDGSLTDPHLDLDAPLRLKLGLPSEVKAEKRYRILVEADKLVSPDNDGVKRYQVELLKALFPVAEDPDSRWQLDLYFHGRINPLRDFRSLLFEHFHAPAKVKGDNRSDQEILIDLIQPSAAPCHGTPRPQLPRPIVRVEAGSGAHGSQASALPEKAGAAANNEQLIPEEPTEAPADIRREPGLALRLERTIMSAVPRDFVAYLDRHNITLLHDTYNFVRGIVTGVVDSLSWLRQALIRRLELTRDWLIRSRDISRDHSRDCLHRISGKLRHSTLGILSIVLDKLSNLLKLMERNSSDSYDLVHLPLPQNYAPFHQTKAPQLVTIHDMTHKLLPQYHTRDNIRNAELGMRHAISHGAHMLAISESSRNDLLALENVERHRTHLVYEAADPATFHYKANRDDCRRVREKYGINFNHPYLICLSTLEPRKNLVNTVRAYLAMLEDDPQLELRLVIAGKRGWGSDGIYNSAASHPDHVFFTGFVDDDDIAFLYSDALALSYLSFYEGFGLPPLEAMRCGTPVIYGDNSSTKEIIADAGLATDPSNLEQIKKQFQRIAREPGLRTKMSHAAFRRANDFSWRRAAIETLALYEDIIEKRV